MGLSRIEEKVFIIKKETVRGTAEVLPAGGRSLPVLPASEVNLNPGLLADTKIYGDAEERPAQGGVRVGVGSLALEPGADKLGELLMSLLGTVVSDQPDPGGAPLVYRHRFKRGADPLHPLYTLFVDRQTIQKKYEGVMCSQMTFSVPLDNRLAVTAELLHKTEKAGAVLTPDFSADLESLLFSDVKVSVAGAPSSLVRQASVVINSNGIAKRVLSQSRDAVDIVAGRLAASGSFVLYFEDETERVKFLASTDSSLNVLAEGQTLQAAQKATLELDLPKIKYSAGPVGEVDGILVQEFAFQAYRDSAAGYQVRASLINKEVTY